MKHHSISALLALAIIASTGIPEARAHEQLKSGDWCATGNVRYDGTFKFEGILLTAFANCLRTGACEAPLEGKALTGRANDAGRLLTPRRADPLSKDPQLKCGQFDPRAGFDDYTVARMLSQQHCALFGPLPTEGADDPTSDIGTVVPVALFPESYNSIDHHALYTLDQGLSGVCAICDPSSIVPGGGAGGGSTGGGSTGGGSTGGGSTGGGSTGGGTTGGGSTGGGSTGGGSTGGGSTGGGSTTGGDSTGGSSTGGLIGGGAAREIDANDPATDATRQRLMPIAPGREPGKRTLDASGVNRDLSATRGDATSR